MSTPLKRTIVLLILAVAAGFAALLLADDTTEGRVDDEGAVEVSMRDYRFQPDELHVPAEMPVTISVVNRDENVHRVTFGRTIVEEDGEQLGFEEDLMAGLDPVVIPRRSIVGGVDHEGPLEVSVDPGETATISVTFPEERVGEWEMGCFNACGAHYRAGLAGTLQVEPGD